MAPKLTGFSRSVVSDRSSTSFGNTSDIYRIAELLIGQHGEGALARADGRAIEIRHNGDLEGGVTWLRIIEAVKLLLRYGPEGAERVH